MGSPTVVDQALLPQAELTRLARVLARFLAGRRPTAASTQVAGRLAGQGLDFLDFRDYQPGDDFRSIDWRASARSRGVQVRRYCGDVTSDWFLCVDASASMGLGDGCKWLQARQLAAAFAYVLLYLGHRVALLLFSGEVDSLCPLGRGHAQYARILATMGEHGVHTRGGSSDIGCCRSLLGPRNPVLVISDFLCADAMLPALSSLQAQQRELHLLQVTDHRDLLLPDSDNLLLQDVESGRTLSCTDSGIAQARARDRLALLQRELSDWSKHCRVPYTACSDDDAWRDVLLRHFMPG